MENNSVDDVQALVAVGDDVTRRHFHAVGRHQRPLVEEVEPHRSSRQRLRLEIVKLNKLSVLIVCLLRLY